MNLKKKFEHIYNKLTYTPNVKSFSTKYKFVTLYQPTLTIFDIIRFYEFLVDQKFLVSKQNIDNFFFNFKSTTSKIGYQKKDLKNMLNNLIINRDNMTYLASNSILPTLLKEYPEICIYILHKANKMIKIINTELGDFFNDLKELIINK
jgi:hypothetical protein